jgi:hypothetical protein
VGVTDSVGNSAIAIVTVRERPSGVSPADVAVASGASHKFTAASGSGTAYVWALVTNPSGGALTASGLYTAGSKGGGVDVVSVTDSLGNTATATATVTAMATATVSPPRRLQLCCRRNAPPWGARRVAASSVTAAELCYSSLRFCAIRNSAPLLKPLVARCGRAQLAHWIFLDRASGQSNEPEHAEARRRLLEAMGGPPGPECYRLHRGGGR